MQNIIIFTFVSFFFLQSNAFAKKMSCEEFLAFNHSLTRFYPIDVAKQKNYISPATQCFKNLTEVYQKYDLTTREFKIFHNNILKVLNDEESVIMHVRLNNIFSYLNDLNKSPHPTAQNILNHLIKELQSYIHESQIQAPLTEVQKLFQESLDTPQLLKILGQTTQKNILSNLFGSNSWDEIEPNSLIGKYLQLSQRKGVQVSTLKTSFYKSPDQALIKGKLGTPRLFISVDERTLPLFIKIFAQNPHFLFHNHTEKQSTLRLSYLNFAVTYASFNTQQISEKVRARIASDWKSSTNLVPMIVLSTTEAHKVYHYFELGEHKRSRAKYPWSLINSENKERYCRYGGYISCTHWFGEMPFGDNFVDKLSFPGQWDKHAEQSDPYYEAHPRVIREAPVGTYNAEYSLSQFTMAPILFKTRVDRLTHLVWRHNKSPMQMWQVLESFEALKKGEFANPGYVLYNLLSTAPQERVPVVFVFRKNASDPLTKKDILNYSKEIDAH